VVILVAGLLVVGEILDRTGVAHVVGDWILKKGGLDETRLLIVIMAGAALLGSVMSSTAIVAIFLPIVLRVAAETNRSASRLLLPMSYAALISGMLTLIASPPNLVVSEELKESGFDGFGFFSFTLVGLAILVVAIVYVVLIGRRLLPGETGEGWWPKSRPFHLRALGGLPSRPALRVGAAWPERHTRRQNPHGLRSGESIRHRHPRHPAAGRYRRGADRIARTRYGAPAG